MTSKRQDAPERLGIAVPRDTEVPDRLAARLAFAEEAVRQDGKRVSEYEQVVALLTMISPCDIGQLLNEVSVPWIVSLLRQIPDFSNSLTQWSEQYFKSADRCDIAEDVLQLESLGVRRESMAIAMQVIKFSPFFDGTFAQLGDKRKRRQRAKRLLAPIPDLADVARVFGEPPPLLSQKFPNPSKIVSELKLLSSMLNWGEFIYDCLRANHLLEVSKFALASLVHEVTGTFHDREVSNLICVALGDYNYDETRHRIWRNDNAERLRHSVPIVSRVLLAINCVASTATTIAVMT